MKHKSKIRGRRFLLWWVVGHAISWLVGMVVGTFISGMVVSVLLDLFEHYEDYQFYADQFIYLDSELPLAYILLYSSIGLIVGLTQRRLLQKYFYWKPDKWIHLTVIGATIGGILWVLWEHLSLSDVYRVFPFVANTFYLLLLVLPPVIGQWLALRKVIRRDWLWIIANCVATIMPYFVIIIVRPDSDFNGSLLTLVAVLIGVVISFWITGKTLLYLFEYHRIEPEMSVEGEPLPPESVWDTAI